MFTSCVPGMSARQTARAAVRLNTDNGYVAYFTKPSLSNGPNADRNKFEKLGKLISKVVARGSFTMGNLPSQLTQNQSLWLKNNTTLSIPSVVTPSRFSQSIPLFSAHYRELLTRLSVQTEASPLLFSNYGNGAYMEGLHKQYSQVPEANRGRFLHILKEAAPQVHQAFVEWLIIHAGASVNNGLSESTRRDLSDTKKNVARASSPYERAKLTKAFIINLQRAHSPQFEFIKNVAEVAKREFDRSENSQKRLNELCKSLDQWVGPDMARVMIENYDDVFTDAAVAAPGELDTRSLFPSGVNASDILDPTGSIVTQLKSQLIFKSVQETQCTEATRALLACVSESNKSLAKDILAQLVRPFIDGDTSFTFKLNPIRGAKSQLEKLATNWNDSAPMFAQILRDLVQHRNFDSADNLRIELPADRSDDNPSADSAVMGAHNVARFLVERGSSEARNAGHDSGRDDTSTGSLGALSEENLPDVVGVGGGLSRGSSLSSLDDSRGNMYLELWSSSSESSSDDDGVLVLTGVRSGTNKLGYLDLAGATNPTVAPKPIKPGPLRRSSSESALCGSSDGLLSDVQHLERPAGPNDRADSGYGRSNPSETSRFFDPGEEDSDSSSLSSSDSGEAVNVHTPVRGSANPYADDAPALSPRSDQSGASGSMYKVDSPEDSYSGELENVPSPSGRAGSGSGSSLSSPSGPGAGGRKLRRGVPSRRVSQSNTVNARLVLSGQTRSGVNTGSISPDEKVFVLIEVGSDEKPYTYPEDRWEVLSQKEKAALQTRFNKSLESRQTKKASNLESVRSPLKVNSPDSPSSGLTLPSSGDNKRQNWNLRAGELLKRDALAKQSTGSDGDGDDESDLIAGIYLIDSELRQIVSSASPLSPLHLNTDHLVDPVADQELNDGLKSEFFRLRDTLASLPPSPASGMSPFSVTQGQGQGQGPLMQRLESVSSPLSPLFGVSSAAISTHLDLLSPGASSPLDLPSSGSSRSSSSHTPSDLEDNVNPIGLGTRLLFSPHSDDESAAGSVHLPRSAGAAPGNVGDKTPDSDPVAAEYRQVGAEINAFSDRVNKFSDNLVSYGKNYSPARSAGIGSESVFEDGSDSDCWEYVELSGNIPGQPSVLAGAASGNVGDKKSDSDPEAAESRQDRAAIKAFSDRVNKLSDIVSSLSPSSPSVTQGRLMPRLESVSAPQSPSVREVSYGKISSSAGMSTPSETEEVNAVLERLVTAVANPEHTESSSVRSSDSGNSEIGSPLFQSVSVPRPRPMLRSPIRFDSPEIFPNRTESVPNRTESVAIRHLLEGFGFNNEIPHNSEPRTSSRRDLPKELLREIEQKLRNSRKPLPQSPSVREVSYGKISSSAGMSTPSETEEVNAVLERLVTAVENHEDSDSSSALVNLVPLSRQLFEEDSDDEAGAGSGHLNQYFASPNHGDEEGGLGGASAIYRGNSLDRASEPSSPLHGNVTQDVIATPPMTLNEFVRDSRENANSDLERRPPSPVASAVTPVVTNPGFFGMVRRRIVNLFSGSASRSRTNTSVEMSESPVGKR